MTTGAEDRSHTPGAFPALVVLYLALSIGFLRTVPIFEAPDEPSHIEFAAFLGREGRLPRIGAKPEVPGEGMQPPLFYAIAAPFFALIDLPDLPVLEEIHRANQAIYHVDDRAVYRNRHITVATEGSGRRLATDSRLDVLKQLRWLTLAFGFAAVVLTYAATRRVTGSRDTGVRAAALMALNPQFAFVSSYVNNDAAAIALSAAGFWLAAGAIRDRRSERGRYLAMALLCCLGLGTKTSTLPSLAVAGLTIFLTDGRARSARVRDAALAVAAIGLLAAPYVIWNVATRGDPLGMGGVWEAAANLSRHDVYPGGVDSYFRGPYWLLTFKSYWALFGWMQHAAPPAVYLLCGLLIAVGLIGLTPRWAARDYRVGPPGLRGYLLTTFGLTLAAHIWINFHELMAQGRHLFVAGPQLACAVALGYERWTRGRGESVERITTSAIVLVLAGLSLYCLLFVLGPAYSRL